MGELWSGIAIDPKVEGLDQRAAAEVLLRAGTLTGWIGSTKQIEGGQETAKNLISQSLAIFFAKHQAMHSDISRDEKLHWNLLS